jgi:hypothetical protein
MRTRAVHMSKEVTLAFLILAMGVQAARPSNAASDNTNHIPLKKVADIPMPGPAVRFDYQSLEASQGPTLKSSLECAVLFCVPRISQFFRNILNDKPTLASTCALAKPVTTKQLPAEVRKLTDSRIWVTLRGLQRSKSSINITIR